MTYRIISKQKDYYDYMQKYGFDPNKVWVREQSCVHLKRESKFAISNSGWARYNLNSDVNLSAVWLGVAGTWRLCFVCSSWEGKSEPAIHFVHWPGLTAYTDDMYFNYSTPTFQNRYARKKFAEFYLEILNKPRTFKDDSLFIEHQSPVLMYDVQYEQLHINPNLHRYDFHKAVPDVIMLWNEITMFLDNNLREQETVNISDKDLRDGKGFDNWSFKTRPAS